ncbi:MAG: hypothetical protein AAFR27_11990 [Pseudomonadota bacterium]
MTHIYFENGRGIKVTSTSLSTRYKDEALAPIQSVQIGREPLLMGCISGFGLLAFGFQFGDLMHWHETVLLSCLGLIILAAGYSIAALRIGQYMHEKTVLWETIWTVQKVRKAIVEAKRQKPSDDVNGAIVLEE